MKQNRDIIIIGILFFVVASILQALRFWSKIGLADPRGLFVQGAVFLALMLFFKNLIFAPFLSICEARQEQTTGKRQDALAKRKQAEEMLSLYDQAITQAKIKAVSTKQSIAMQAEEQERKTLDHARSVSDANVKKQLQEVYTQADSAQKNMHQNIPDIASVIVTQVFSNKGASRP